MERGGYKIRNKQGIHFITFSVVEWVDVFTRNFYKDIIVDSLRYCQIEKLLALHSWCLMTNHFHMIASAKNNNLSDILRDFKTFTSKKILSAIGNNLQESRREWMLPIFRKHGSKNSRNSEFQFWQQDNHPMELFSSKFIFQKMNYIHQNPVKAGIVDLPEHYLYSSARNYVEYKNCGLLEMELLY